MVRTMSTDWVNFDPHVGFTSSVITTPGRFVGRDEIIKSCINALNTDNGLIAVYGPRGVGKSSLLRQVQTMATGDYSLARSAGLDKYIPNHPRTYLTVFYTCDSLITDSRNLLKRMCNDKDGEDGLLRLVPDEGRVIEEFSRSKGVGGGIDLKVVNFKGTGTETAKYAKIIEGDDVQTFRNFLDAAVLHSVQKRMNRDALLILLDEFDVIQHKEHIGSLIKSLTSSTVKFGICGISDGVHGLVNDHASVERLLEGGTIRVDPMPREEIAGIILRAESLYKYDLRFDEEVREHIANLSQGYPYFAQLLGKQCVHQLNANRQNVVTENVFNEVATDIRDGKLLPTLEGAYKNAVGHSEDRQWLLHLFADQPGDLDGVIRLKDVRDQAKEFNTSHVDQNIGRLLDPKYGPALRKVGSKAEYQFVNPLLRLYVRMRSF